MGRRPLPTHLKLLRGNPGHGPINLHEPKPPRSMPDAPSHLHPFAKEEWNRLALMVFNLDLLTPADRAAFAAYCQVYAVWRQAEEEITAARGMIDAESGLIDKTKNGNFVISALRVTANSAMRDMVKFAGEFGLTPSSRTKIDTRSGRLPPVKSAGEDDEQADKSTDQAAG